MGVPDISFVAPEFAGWIETKYTRGNQKLKIRPSQVNWMCDRAKYPTFRAFLVCEAGERWLACRVTAEDRFKLLEGVNPSNFHKLEYTDEGPLQSILAFVQLEAMARSKKSVGTAEPEVCVLRGTG